MISEGTCDTEDWVTAKNSASQLQEYITFDIILKWKMVILNCDISQCYFFFYCIVVKKVEYNIFFKNI